MRAIHGGGAGVRRGWRALKAGAASLPLLAAVHAARLGAQLHAGEPARDPLAVAERLLAVQAQDPRGMRLAVRARSSDLCAADVDRALTEERSLVVTTLNRGTLHLVRSEDLPWLHALTAPALMTTAARRLADEGVPPGDAERGVTEVERALAEDGPLVRGRLRERLDADGVRTAGQALVWVLALAGLRGLVVRGPVVDGEHAHVLVRDWLGEPPPFDRDVALAELARRYLAGHGPASDRDPPHRQRDLPAVRARGRPRGRDLGPCPGARSCSTRSSRLRPRSPPPSRPTRPTWCASCAGRAEEG
ncbi:MAG: winged helix DNA-binding domain-containing protein [Actinomycetota bacterium]|nr:winged helix DNA-binding domain-containing protein [Actinomycetota bacterium]